MIPEILLGLKLYEKDEKLCKKLPLILSSWQSAYPLVDIKARIKCAHAWELANHQKKNRIRFLNNWLKNDQENAEKNQTLVHRLPIYKETNAQENEIVDGDMFTQLRQNLVRQRLRNK